MSFKSHITEAMKDYMGESIKPDNFDKFWDDKIKAINSFQTEVKYEKSEFSSKGTECYDMYFKSLDGALIHVKHLRPANITGKIPVIIQFHGYGDDSGAWSDKLKFIQAGYAVFAMDVRGQGGKSEDIGGVKGNTTDLHLMRGMDNFDPDKLFYTKVFIDATLLANIVLSQDYIDSDKLCVQGQSQGGALSAVCAALVPQISKAAILFPYLCDYKKMSIAYPDTGVGYCISAYFKKHDPIHERHDEVFGLLGYIDIQNFANRIKADVYMGTALKDTTCPPITQAAFYNKLNCSKEVTYYPEYAHETINHFNDAMFMFLTK